MHLSQVAVTRLLRTTGCVDRHLGCFTNRTLDQIGEWPPVGPDLHATLDIAVKHKKVLYFGVKRSIIARIELQLTFSGTPFGQAVVTSVQCGGLDQDARKFELIMNVDSWPISCGEQLAATFERSLDNR